MARLSIYLLGPFRVTLDGEPATSFKYDHVRALLAYLVVEADRPHRRERLAGLLWPEQPDPLALSNLRYALYHLRQAIGDHEAMPPFLLTTRETLQFNTASDHWLDIAAFEQHITDSESANQQIGNLKSAIELYRGRFMEGFSLGDSPLFEEWLLFKQEHIDRQMLSALHRLIQIHTARGEYERSEPYARQLLALEPWDEEAHRQLMRLLALSGRRGAALAQYETCRRVLAEELGVEPADETTALHERIRSGEVVRVGVWEPTNLPPRPHTPTPSAPFVARGHELARLDEFLRLALAGQGRVVFVTGDAGSGKTVLIGEFARRAMERYGDILVAGGRCNAHAGIGDPYLPFREVLQMLTGDIEARWASGGITAEHARRLWAVFPDAVQALANEGPDLIDRFLPGEALLVRAEAFAPGDAAWWTRLEELAKRQEARADLADSPQADLFEQVTQVLQTLACQYPLILLLDDLQWADAASISLLFHLGRRLAGSRILIVGAYRPAEVVMDREGNRHPLHAIVHEFHRDFGEIRVDLDQAEGRPFVDAFLDAWPNDLGESFRERLYRVTEGHALFTVELVREMQEHAGLVRDEAGRWVEGEALNWACLPPRVEAVIAGHISRLPAEWQQTLAAASVEGEVFTAEVVARVQGLDEGEVLRRLNGPLSQQHHLVCAHSLERLDGQRLSRYRFRHHLFQRYLYDRLNVVERAHLHQAVGTTLEALHRNTEGTLATVAPRLAFHFEAAGLVDQATAYLLQAGRRAYLLSACEESIALCRRGLALLETLPAGDERDRREMDLQLALIQPCGVLRGWGAREQVEAVTRAHELAQRLGEPGQLLPALLHLASTVIGQGKHRQALDLSGQALRLAQQAQESCYLALAHQWLGACYFFLGELAPAREHLEQATDLYRRLQPLEFDRLPFQVAAMGEDAMVWLPHVLWMLGYPDQALAKSEEAMALAHKLARADRRMLVLTIAVVAFHALRGEELAVQAASERLLSLAKEEGLPVFQAYGTSYQGWAQARQGQATQGIAQMHAGLTALRSIGTQAGLPHLMALLAEAYLCAGQPEEGLRTMDEVLALAEKLDARSWVAEMHRLRGELLKAEGERQKTEECFQQAIEVARQQAAKSWELRATMSLCRLWQQQGRSAEAREVLATVYGWFTEGFDTPDLQAAKALLEELS